MWARGFYREKMMNAIEFLIHEHNNVKKMLAEINGEAHGFENKKQKFNLLASDLIRHENMEQQVWYPHFKNKVSDTVKHLVSEEKHAEEAIQKLEASKTEEAWETLFLKFKHDVEHHAQEEENDLFPEVQKLLSEQELEEIGEEMSEFKNEYREVRH
jgi:hemerythrin-like domain-containing protein